MGCGSSQSTAVAVVQAAGASDILDQPEDGEAAVNSSSPPAKSSGGAEPDSGVNSPGSINAAPASTEVPNSRQESQETGQVSAAAGQTSQRPAAFDVAFDAPATENIRLTQPRRLPRLQKLDTRRPATSRKDIEEKIAVHDQRRKDELAKKTEAQRSRQSRRDKLLAEVQAARALEAQQNAKDTDELADGLPEDDSMTDLMKIDKQNEEDISNMLEHEGQKPFGLGLSDGIVIQPDETGNDEGLAASEEDEAW
ncbi:uncharacterized protein LOC135816103 [Sycon ciliatum]|uniref:uncharacterized protein LOC135816103 n=1 Tax=Sycon ciliatum TaxID=27933 RepID=UPI0020AE0CD4|eukprot:scpid52939/ scgid28868/ 